MQERKITKRFKRPESVLVVVATAQAEVLMLRRRNPPDFWQSVTGSLDWGESTAVAARRELEEETGLHAGSRMRAAGIVNRYPIAPAWRRHYAADVTFNVEYVFYLQLAEQVEIKLNLKEHSQARWLSSAAAAQLASSTTNCQAIRQLVVNSR